MGRVIGKRNCLDCGAEIINASRCRACHTQHRHATSTRKRGYPAKQKWGSCPLPWRSCEWCGKRFFARSCRKFCSDTCIYSARPSRHHPERIIFCACGNMTEHVYIKQCPECWRTNRNLRVRRDKRKRAAAKLGATSEPYTIREIALRDGMRCGLCGKTVTTQHKHPHPDAPKESANA